MNHSEQGGIRAVTDRSKTGLAKIKAEARGRRKNKWQQGKMIELTNKRLAETLD